MYRYINVNGPDNTETNPVRQAKETIQVGDLVFQAAPDANGNTLVKATPSIMPHEVWLAQEYPNPRNQVQWRDDTEPKDHVYQVGDRVELIETFPRYHYKAWVNNDTGGPLTLNEGDKLTIHPTVPGKLKVLTTPVDTTISGLAELNNVIFLVSYETSGDGTTRYIADTENGLVFVKRVGG